MTCRIPECYKPARSKNLCQGHYKRLLEGRDLSTPLRVVDPTRTCKFDRCGQKHWGKGYCQYHYQIAVQGHGEEGFKSRSCGHCATAFKPTSHNNRWCKGCVPDSKARSRMQQFGLSQPEYEAMRSRVDKVCPVCQVREASCVDHCHSTGVVRGVLCKRCNTVLHEVENADWMQRAIRYLNGT